MGKNQISEHFRVYFYVYIMSIFNDNYLFNLLKQEIRNKINKTDACEMFATNADIMHTKALLEKQMAEYVNSLSEHEEGIEKTINDINDRLKDTDGELKKYIYSVYSGLIIKDTAMDNYINSLYSKLKTNDEFIYNYSWNIYQHLTTQDINITDAIDDVRKEIYDVSKEFSEHLHDIYMSGPDGYKILQNNINGIYDAVFSLNNKSHTHKLADITDYRAFSPADINDNIEALTTAIETHKLTYSIASGKAKIIGDTTISLGSLNITRDESSKQGGNLKVEYETELNTTKTKTLNVTDSATISNASVTTLYAKNLDVKEMSSDLKKLIIDLIYPVGSIYISETNDNPNKIFGRGVWERINGAYLFSRAEANSNNIPTTLKNWGGDYKITQDHLPAHSHGLTNLRRRGSENYTSGNNFTVAAWGGPSALENTTNETGGGKPFFPRFWGVNAWRRTG